VREVIVKDFGIDFVPLKNLAMYVQQNAPKYLYPKKNLFEFQYGQI
jgi:hypothetical protein